ncbi:MAG TPA: hypothetical protein VMH86_05485 [Rhizomicrobium sp.]|nr:hypothetical protein [Rhizomicrobium sp.]
MPRQWDIVEVPGESWPAEGGGDSFLAVVVSSSFASEKANIYWVCPIRSSKSLRHEPGYIPIKQYKPPVFRSWGKRMDGWLGRKAPTVPQDIDASLDMVRTDLVITVTRHEMKATNYGAVDMATRRRMAATLRKFAAFAAPPR